MWEHTSYTLTTAPSPGKNIAYCQEKSLSFFKSLVLQLKRRCITGAAQSSPSWCSAQRLSACRKSRCNGRLEQQAPSVTC